MRCFYKQETISSLYIAKPQVSLPSMIPNNHTKVTQINKKFGTKCVHLSSIALSNLLDTIRKTESRYVQDIDEFYFKTNQHGGRYLLPQASHLCDNLFQLKVKQFSGSLRTFEQWTEHTNFWNGQKKWICCICRINYKKQSRESKS